MTTIENIYFTDESYTLEEVIEALEERRAIKQVKGHLVPCRMLQASHKENKPKIRRNEKWN